MAESDSTPRQPATGTPPDEFVRLLRDALAHLYDPSHLSRHPLNTVLAPALPSFGNAAQNLRDYLFDAIDSLEPPGNALSSEKERRPYLVLFYRYVAGYSIAQIIERLHISTRQFRREHHAGLQALAMQLWPHGRIAEPNPTPALVAEPSQAASLQSEVSSLGLELANLSLTELVESARMPAEMLARHAGAGFTTAIIASHVRCFCDRALARQALLSAISATIGQRPGHVEVVVASIQRLPCLEVRIRPALADEQLPVLRAELATCASLLAAQGGRLKLLKTEGGLVSGVRLYLRPETAAKVLAIDDNDKMLRLYERYLAAGRYSVTSVTSAKEAEEALQAATPDVVILDVMMRDVDGWELLQRLHTRPALARVPILVCSVLNEARMAFALGARGYLRKPVAPDDLLRALRQLLAESSRGEPSPAEP
ncbi:MAG: response regulator [Anaerolineae bacterium]